MPGRAGGGDDALGHLGAARVGRAVGRVVQIVELGDGGEARLQHLDIKLRRDRLDLVGLHRQREAIHGLAPGPERVRAVAAPLGEPGHRALEGVAVQVGERGQAERVTLVAGLRARRPSRPRRCAPASVTRTSAPAAGRQRARGVRCKAVRCASASRLDPIMDIVYTLKAAGSRERHGRARTLQPQRSGATPASRPAPAPGLGVIERGALVAAATGASSSPAPRPTRGAATAPRSLIARAAGSPRR